LGFELQSQHEILQTLPVHHSYGIIAYILTPITVGCSVNFCPGMMGLRTVRKKADKVHSQSVLHVSPSQARFILKDAVSVEAVKKISIGGGSVSIQELKSLKALLPMADIYVSYGLTEAGPRVTAGRYSEHLLTELSLQGHEHWIGSAIDQVQLHLTDSTDGQVGRLCIDSPYLKKNISHTELKEGKLLTRDRVRLEKDQVLFLSREDDLLKYGGVTIYPQDIESIVRKWKGVTDVIVLKQEDPVYGDVPVLFIEGSLALQKAQDLVNNEIPFSTAIREIHILEKFPRQSLEKVDRKKLLESVRSQTQ
jgi:long-chain acyl-CoA synthetase